jgi:hypothetical protein
MVDLTWSIGDGVIFYLRPLNEMKETITKMQSKKKIDVTCQIITSITEDSDIAINRAKKTLAFYVSVGKIYREFLAKNGFKNETSNIFDEFKKSGFKSNHELVTGIDLPIIQFNPVGNTSESFELLKKTFLDE